ncbi:MAG: rod shape-determining protein, partial [Bacteroidales bacterium]|nr:rod shape-determining protein [Bacteroidales bacterium]
MSFLSKDLGIDLGTANVVIYAEGKGIVLREPSVVAVDKNTGKVLKVGAAARNMLGRTPGNVVAVRPMQGGVASDYEMTQKMLTEFFHRISRFSFVKPRVIISVPSGVTSIEERAVVQIAQEAGARRVYLIEESLAAALGANLNFSGPDGHMVVDIGGGTTDIGVLTMNGLAQSSSIRVAGNTFDEAIIRYLRKKYGLLVGQTTAEDAKIMVGSVFERGEPVVTKIKGRDFKTGLAREMMVSSADMVEALRRPARQITDEILSVLEQTTPELVADIARNGIVLTGGGSQIWGMDKLITDRTGIACSVADDADSCVAYGCGKSLRWINRMQEG